MLITSTTRLLLEPIIMLALSNQLRIRILLI